MDKFEEHMKELMQMSEAERMANMEKSKKVFICVGCPSYTGTGETGLLFCATGKSSIITEEKGCICSGCPMTERAGLTHEYFCTRGSEAEQRGMRG